MCTLHHTGVDVDRVERAAYLSVRHTVADLGRETHHKNGEREVGTLGGVHTATS
jgi:hypothetical protein